MYEKKIPPQTECGLHFFKELLTGKWKLMLLYYISEGFERPSELQKQILNADRRVLKQQLDELVLHGFITKQTYGQKVLTVQYQLTSLGKSLLPLIVELEQWGEHNRQQLERALQNDDKFRNVLPEKT